MCLNSLFTRNLRSVSVAIFIVKVKTKSNNHEGAQALKNSPVGYFSTGAIRQLTEQG
jgi:hypothetical protein